MAGNCCERLPRPACSGGRNRVFPHHHGSYGKEFLGGTSVLICLVLSAVVVATFWSVGQAITSSGKMWWGFVLSLIWGIALISALWLFRHRGAYGYAVATLIAYSIHVLTSMYVYWRVHTQFAPLRGGPG